MTITFPTKTDILNKQNMVVLANSNLTSVRISGRLNALNLSTATVLSDFYRDLSVSYPQLAMQGAFSAFSFGALPGNYASTQLSVTVSGATVIQQGYTGSTVGTSGSPAVIFVSTSAVSASGAGTISVPIQAVNVGASGNVPANTITNQISSASNVVSITNATSATGGSDPETLSQQLARFQTYLDSLPGGTDAALAYAANLVNGVYLASAVSNPYLTGLRDNAASFTDMSQELNMPKGVPFQPFVSSPSVGDAFYIGYNGIFTGLYIDVATVGSSMSAAWQYWNGSAWTTLTTTSDGTNTGEQSGTVAWAVPSDWAETTIDSAYTGYFIRLELTATAYTTLPAWYQAFANDPPPGYVFVYISANPNVANVLQNVQTALESVRAAGDTAIVLPCVTQSTNVSVSVIPTAAGASVGLLAIITSAIQNLFNSLVIGQSLPQSAIDYAISSLGAGSYVKQVNVISPTGNTPVSPDVLLTLGTLSVNILSATTN